jgi:hypothetical protein
MLLFALLGYSAFGFKSSMGLHIMGSLLVVGLALSIKRTEREFGYTLCLTAGASLLIMAVDLFLLRESGGPFAFSFDLFNQFQHSLKMLTSGKVSLFLIPLFFIGYVIATFGVRIFGLYLICPLLKEKKFNLSISFLLVFGLTGFILSETTRLGNSTSINNSIWFTIQGLMGCWLLFGYFLKEIRGKKWLYVFFMSSALLLAAPTTAQFLKLRFDKRYVTVDANAMEVVSFLKTTEPDSTVIHLPNNNGPSLASNLAGRSSVLNSFRSFVGVYDSVSERLQDSISFFSPRTSVQYRKYILKKYGVNYVYAPANYGFIFRNYSFLKPVLINDSLIVYEVQLEK